jgi:hypothetical protein
MPDLEFQDISTVHSSLQPKPPTIASTTAGIAPRTFLSFVSGTAAIATITPPVTGAHLLCIVFTTTQSGQFPTTGNITSATTTATANVPQFLVWDPSQNKYFTRLA